MLKKLLAIFVFIILCLGAGFGYFMYNLQKPIERKSRFKIIVLPQDSEEDICKKLVSSKCAANIYTAWFSLKYQRYCNKEILPGEYRISMPNTLLGVLDILCSGRVVIHNIIIYRGSSKHDIVEALYQRDDLFGEITINFSEEDLIAGKFEFVHPTTKDELLIKINNAKTMILDEEWQNRSEACAFDTKEKVFVLSSIVAKEAMCAEDIPLIASVYINRLRLGMRLQADPTVIFAITSGLTPFQRPLNYEDLKIEHPFNTYRKAGIPPNAISVPSREDIRAVTQPMQTNYLYFISDGINKKHYFSKTHDEHLLLKMSFRKKKAKIEKSTQAP